MSTLPASKVEMTGAHELSEEELALTNAQSVEDGPINLVRYPDWQERWVRFVTESLQEGIKCDWEFNHCGGWAAMGIEEITGHDFFAPFSTRPIKGPEDVYLAIKHAGYTSLEEYVHLNFVEVPLAFAHRVDLVMIPQVEGDFSGLGMSQALGLADPPFAWALGSQGLGRVPLFSCSHAFAVGSL